MKTRRNWTPQEVQFLKDNYPTKGAQFCADALNRPKYLISLKARSLGIKCLLRFWRKEEDEFLLTHYKSKGLEYCAKQLKRTKDSVLSKANLMGLKVDLANWQPNEIKILEENYPDNGPTYCTRKLKRFTKHQVIHKAKTLNLIFTPAYKKVPCPDGHKVCTRCLIAKPLTEFYVYKNNIIDSKCADCNRDASMRYVNTHKEQVYARNKKWIKENQEHIKNYRKGRRSLDRVKVRNRYKNDPEFRQKKIEISREYRQDPKNKKTIKTTQDRLRKEYEKDPYFRLIRNLRRNLLHVLAGNRKADFTMNLVSCSHEYLEKHIESQFLPGMTWENYGKVWVVDHIVPLDSFDMKIPDDQRKAMHHTNLQPLWATTPIANAHGDFINEGNAEKRNRLLGPTIKPNLPSHHPTSSVSPPSQPLPVDDVPSCPFHTISELRP